MSIRIPSGTWFVSPLSMLVTATALLLAVPSAPARAQTQNADNNGQVDARADKHMPPPILVIYKEDVKAGRVIAHDKLEANFARTYAKLEGARPYLAMNSMTGPTQAWFLQGYASLLDVEKESQAIDKAVGQTKTALEQIGSQETEALNEQKAITTVFREDLSYRPSVDLPKMRYMEVVTYRVRPGHDQDFAEAAKIVRSGYEKANLPMEWAIYQVYSGAPGGTYFVFRPVDSLAKIDPTNRQRMESFDKALGPDGMKKLSQLESDGIVSSEMEIYSFNPKTSFAPPEFAAADSFWAQPTQLAQVGTSGKTAAKPAVKKTVRKHPQ